MRTSWLPQAACGALLLFSLGAGARAQSAAGDGAPPRQPQADQQGAAAGEAPPAPVQSARTPADPGDLERRPDDAVEHLERIEAIVDEVLGPREKPAAGDAVGTTGTPMTAATGETVVMQRAKLEEIRLHLQQMRMALAAPPKPAP
jgi:hypothetical protein